MKDGNCTNVIDNVKVENIEIFDFSLVKISGKYSIDVIVNISKISCIRDDISGEVIKGNPLIEKKKNINLLALRI